MKTFMKYGTFVLSTFLVSGVIAKDITPPQLNSNSSYINTIEDNLGKKYLVYQDGNDADKRGTLVKYDGSSWNIVPSFEGVSGTNYINETGYEFQQNAMDVDSNNKLHLLYIDYDPNFDEAILSYQRYNKNSNAYHGWESQTFNAFFSDGLDGSSSYTPLAKDLALDINSTDTPIAAYVADDNSVHVRFLNDHGTQGTDSDSSNFDDDTWDNLGTLNLNSSEIDMVIDADVPYLAYKENNGGKLSVMKYTSNAWTLLDANISSGSVSNIDIYVTENNLYISYIDSGTTPVVVKLRRYIPVAFVEESIQTIVQVTSTDTPNITYAIAGNDKTFFSITNDGNLSFTNKPSFETKDDNNSDGIYEVDVVLINNDTNLSNQLNYNISLINIDDLPVLNPIAGQTQVEDFNDFNITLIASDDDNDTITYSAASSNQSIATVSIVNGKVVVTPIENKSGLINIEVNATANGETATREFDLTITAVDDAPYFITEIPNQTKDEDAAAYSLTITNDATDVEGDSFTYGAQSNNTDLVTVAVVANNGITLTPQANKHGTTTIDLNVTQDNNSTLFSVYSFSVTINSVNDKPQVTTALTDTILNNAGLPVNVTLTIDDVEGDELSLTVDSNNSTVLTITPYWENIMNYATYNEAVLDFNLTSSDGFIGDVNVSVVVKDAHDDNNTYNFIASIVSTEHINYKAIYVDDYNYIQSFEFDTHSKEGYPWTATQQKAPNNGSIMILDNQVVYTPDNGYDGNDSFVLKFDDGGHSQAYQTFDILNHSKNSTPVLVMDLDEINTENDRYEISNSVQLDNDDYDVYRITATEAGKITLNQTRLAPQNNRNFTYKGNLAVGSAFGKDDIFTYRKSLWTQKVTIPVEADESIYFWVDTRKYYYSYEKAYDLTVTFEGREDPQENPVDKDAMNLGTLSLSASRAQASGNLSRIHNPKDCYYVDIEDNASLSIDKSSYLRMAMNVGNSCSDSSYYSNNGENQSDVIRVNAGDRIYISLDVNDIRSIFRRPYGLNLELYEEIR